MLLPLGDRMSRGWLAKSGNPFLPEIDAIAASVKVPGAYALNICYEWGCTTGVYARDAGPVLTRVLDWPFPDLGRHVVVAHQRGPAGDFYNATWPGVCGMFQGMAPGRFAATINQAPMRRHRMTYAGDWAANRRLMFRNSALPPEHLLRLVFEEAADFAAAKARLSATPVAMPVIYTLSGTSPGEGCIIERTERDSVIRPLDGDRVCAGNHFESRLNVLGAGWRPRPIDSAGRVRAARAVQVSAIDADFAWFQPPIANAHSRLAMYGDAAAGTMTLMGTAGHHPATAVFRLG